MKLENNSYSIDDLTATNIEVGKYSQIGEKVYFHCNLDHPSVIDKKVVANFPFANMWEGIVNYVLCGGSGKIIIGNDVWIGRESKILDNVSIGSGAIVAAYSVVTKDVPPYALVAGNPAKIKKFRFTQEQIKSLLKIKWWDWSKEEIIKKIDDFKDIDKFILKYEKRIF